jgi:hypothetical protein
MQPALPLSALLSQAYVAFTIEFDNEFEHRVPHRTTNHGFTPGFPRAPWLVSMAMWIRFLRFIPDQGIVVSELKDRLAISRKGLQVWLTRLNRWWGYLRIEPAPGSSPAKTIQPGAFVLPTEGGRKAIAAGRVLLLEIEGRWRQRFGADCFDRLVAALRTIADRLGPDAPDYFAVLEYENGKLKSARAAAERAQSSLPQLLAKALIAFASDYDRAAAAPLALCSNVLRITGNEGVLVRDLPRLTGLAVVGVTAECKQLIRLRLAAIGGDPSRGRAKLLTLAAAGICARDQYSQRAAEIEEHWQERFGLDVVRNLRGALEEFADPAKPGYAALLGGIAPYPDGWRAALLPLKELPHFPAVSHRGGFPDGS